MMNTEETKALLQKYLAQTCSAEEKATVESWYNLRGMKNASFDSQEDLELTEALIWNDILRIAPVPNKKPRRFNYIVAAASIILVLGIASWFYMTQYRTDEVGIRIRKELVDHDIAPGSNLATLTLADGTTVDLNDTKAAVVINGDKLMYGDGTEVATTSVEGPKVIDRTGSNGVKWLTASTPRGGQYQVVLPDGSKVWLNADSRLRFPSTFSGLANRKVELKGEAYFEISKDKEHAFIVASKGQEVAVLGTHFNIDSYRDEGFTKTTLLEGAVSVTALEPGRQNRVVLRPNQQAVLTADQQLSVKEVDAVEVASWKNGKFIFNSEALGSIMKQVERWYNVQVSFQDDIKDLKLTGAISRYENISGLLMTLEATGEVHFEIDGNQILVRKRK